MSSTVIVIKGNKGVRYVRADVARRLVRKEVRKAYMHALEMATDRVYHNHFPDCDDTIDELYSDIEDALQLAQLEK